MKNEKRSVEVHQHAAKGDRQKAVKKARKAAEAIKKAYERTQKVAYLKSIRSVKVRVIAQAHHKIQNKGVKTST